MRGLAALVGIWIKRDKKSGLSMKLKLDIHLKLSELRVSDSEVPSSVSINALIHKKSLLFHKY